MQGSNQFTYFKVHPYFPLSMPNWKHDIFGVGTALSTRKTKQNTMIFWVLMQLPYKPSIKGDPNFIHGLVQLSKKP